MQALTTKSTLQDIKDRKLTEQVLCDYAPYVISIAKKIYRNIPKHIELDDLISAGFVGLIEAFERFDPGKDVQFKTYSGWRIRGAILDELRELDTMSRLQRKRFKEQQKEQSQDSGACHGTHKQGIEAHVLVPFEDHEESLQSTEQASDVFEQTELKSFMFEFIESLPEIEGMIVFQYFYEEMNLKQIASGLNISESRVSQLRARALEKLRKKMYRHDLY